VGARGAERGTDFSAFIPVVREQMPPGTSATVVGSATAASWSPNRYVMEQVVGAGATEQAAYVLIQAATLGQYYGKYRMIVRGIVSAGAFADARVYVNSETLYSYATIQHWQTPSRPFFADSTPSWVDCGVVDLMQKQLIPGVTGSFGSGTSMTMIIYATNIGGSSLTVQISDLILIPIDEWVTDLKFYDVQVNSGILDFDSVGHYPERYYAAVRNLSNDPYTFFNVSGDYPTLSRKSKTRLWFLHFGREDSALTQVPYISNTSSVRIATTKRYGTFRGNE